jgi:hypothetical protein
MEYPRKEFKDLLNFFHMTGEPLSQKTKNNTPIEDLLPKSCVTEKFQILAKYLCPCSRENLHRFLSLNMGMPLHRSTIVFSKDHIVAIEKWLRGVNMHGTPRLLYRASLHGNTAADFHANCDGKGATITLIKTAQGCIFGGYKDIPWGASPVSSKRTRDDSFLFSLVSYNKERSSMWCCTLQQSAVKMDNRWKDNTETSLLSRFSEGPVFGINDNYCDDIYGDLSISYGKNGGKCQVHCKLGNSYEYYPGNRYSRSFLRPVLSSLFWTLYFCLILVCPYVKIKQNTPSLTERKKGRPYFATLFFNMETHCTSHTLPIIKDS